MVNKRLSKEIYNHLINGKIINRDRIENDAFVADELYSEIMQHEDAYREQYDMCGYNLHMANGYIYLLEKVEKKDLKTDVVMRCYVLLLIIAKYMNDINKSHSQLISLNGGISKAEIDSINESLDVKELLKKCDFNSKDDLFTNIKSQLIDRHILLEKTGSQRYVLSQAGKFFFDEISKINVNIFSET
jgi:hypothetical protein